MPPTILYNVREAAKALNVGRSTLYQLIQSGALKSVKIGQRRLVHIESLKAYAASLAGAAA